MTYEHPDAAFREWSESNNAAQRDLCKARTMIENAIKSAERGRTKTAVASLRSAQERLDKAQGRLHPRGLTQWRQRTLVPRALRRQKSVGPPEDLVCKKCGEQREAEDFHWSDGVNEGYTKRCAGCRRGGRKQALREAA